MLPAFLKWLHEKYVIDHHCVKNEDDAGFYTRFYIQKCVYMAQRLGLDTGYRYRPRMDGPHSKDLADACRDYDHEAPIDERLPPDFEQIGDVVLRAHSKGYAWMEVATMILEDVRMCNAEGRQCARDQIELHVANWTHQYIDRYIHTVYDDLLQTPLGEGLPTMESSLATVRTP